MYEVREQLCRLHFLLLFRVAGPELSDYGPSTPVLKSYSVIALLPDQAQAKQSKKSNEKASRPTVRQS